MPLNDPKRLRFLGGKLFQVSQKLLQNMLDLVTRKNESSHWPRFVLTPYRLCVVVLISSFDDERGR